MRRRFIGVAGTAALAVVVTAAGNGAYAGERVVLHVASFGNDGWSGKSEKPNAEKSDGPFETIGRARDAIRRMKRDGGLPREGVVVEILGGRYELAEPIELTAEDSGTAESPIVYRGRAGEVVRLSGGRIVAGWRAVTEAAILGRLDPAARGQVLQADLRWMGITEYGDLGVDVGADLQSLVAGADGQGEYTMGSVAPKPGVERPERLEVFFNDEPMRISRGPNDGHLTIETALGATERNVRGHKSRVEGVFRYKGDYPRRWVGEKDAYVCGSWCRDWAEQRHRIASLDVDKRVISVCRPYHRYGYHKGQWFYGFNILAELDRPGEWYVDRETGTLYFWPPARIEGAKVEVSMSPGLVRMKGTSHVTIRGLTFEATRGTAVAIENGEHCRVIGCTLRNLGMHAVTVVGGKDNGVIGCDMYGMGGGGVYLIGGDRKTLTPAGHHAENNRIHHYARWDRMYRPGVVFTGVGQRISHNLIHDAPHAALIFGGNDHLVELNEIHHVCCESNDCGAIYAGRDWTIRGHVIRYNYLHHLQGRAGRRCKGIYLDDLFSSATVWGNVFYQATYAVFLGGGRDNIIENNVFVDCPQALHIDARALGWCGPHADGRIKEAREKGTIRGIRYGEPPYSTRYPKLVRLLEEDPKSPVGNVVRRNIFWAGAGEALRRDAQGAGPRDTWWEHIEAKIRPLVKLEDNLINEDPKFVDEKAGDFQLRADSPAWGLGFQRIPIEKIGLYRDERRASWPVKQEVR
ncbi:MAG: right-handed parallel beta-helix repeat-containing protein [Phycisphaerae bacterium]|nr:right-handed parallel beta-helix repeat-containing protein [Phycisphaerae bacterium]